jgi:hypothetical protein
MPTIFSILRHEVVQSSGICSVFGRTTQASSAFIYNHRRQEPSNYTIIRDGQKHEHTAARHHKLP